MSNFQEALASIRQSKPELFEEPPPAGPDDWIEVTELSAGDIFPEARGSTGNATPKTRWIRKTYHLNGLGRGLF